MARALRAVSLVLTLVSVVAFSTIAYSAYADVQGVTGIFGGTGSSAVTTRSVTNGSGTTVIISVALPNKGLYPLMVGVSCQPSNGSVRFTCRNASVTVQPGLEGVLNFSVTFQNLTQSELSGLQAPAKVQMALQPFAELDLTVNLGSMLK